MSYPQPHYPPSDVTLPPIRLLFDELLQRESAKPEVPQGIRPPHLSESHPPNARFLHNPLPPLQMRPAGHAPPVGPFHIQTSVITYAKSHQVPIHAGPSSQDHRPPNTSGRSATVQGSQIVGPLARHPPKKSQMCNSMDNPCFIVPLSVLQRSIPQNHRLSAIDWPPTDLSHNGKRQIFSAIPFSRFPFVAFEAERVVPSCNGTAMTEVVTLRHGCVKGPDDPVLTHLPYHTIKLYLSWEGYPAIVREIPIRCEHGPVTRFRLAAYICIAFHVYFKEGKFNQALVTIGNVVHNINRLRLMALYTEDGLVWKAQIATVLDY